MSNAKAGAPKKIPQSVIDVVVACALVVSIFVAMFAYTGSWPPLVVVESKSMQHSATESSFGVMDTGDLVLVKKVWQASEVTTYIQGVQNGYETYDDLGDVIIFNRDGQIGGTPVIHRAIAFLTANTDKSYRIVDLRMLVRGVDYDLNKTSDSWERITGDLMLYNYGYRQMNLTIHIDQMIKRITVTGAPLHDGFITKGDFNPADDLTMGIINQPISINWILGAARGEIPWFGIIKLFITGTLPSDAPSNSMMFLIVSIGVIVAIPVGSELFFWLRARKKGGKVEEPTEKVEKEDTEKPAPPKEEPEPEAKEEEDKKPSEEKPQEKPRKRQVRRISKGRYR